MGSPQNNIHLQRGAGEISRPSPYVCKADINDIFWFEEDTIAEWLGYSDFEELMKDRS